MASFSGFAERPRLRQRTSFNGLDSHDTSFLVTCADCLVRGDRRGRSVVTIQPELGIPTGLSFDWRIGCEAQSHELIASNRPLSRSGMDTRGAYEEVTEVRYKGVA
jgi:hypothetical protein